MRKEDHTSTQNPRFDRLHSILAFLLCGLVALCLLLYVRGRSGTPSLGKPEAAGSTVVRIPETVERGPESVAPSVKAGEEASASKGEPRRSGRILGRINFPRAGRNEKSFSYQIYVFGADGLMDGPRAFANSDRFELPNLAPGRKAIFFFSPTEALTCPYQVVVVPEGADVEVQLRPRLSHALEGRVVDANGSGLGGMYVTVAESLALPQELYLQGKPSSVARLETTVNATGVTASLGANSSDIPVWILKIYPDEGRIFRGAITDARGRFSLPLTSDQVPAPLTVSRGLSEVLKEEIVIPSAGPVRIILPNQ